MMTVRRSTRGETIVEALVSILIATLVFSFLTNAVVTAARINAEIRNEDVSFELDGVVATGSPVTVTITPGTLNGEVLVQPYATSAEEGEVSYSYYEFQQYNAS